MRMTANSVKTIKPVIARKSPPNRQLKLQTKQSLVAYAFLTVPLLFFLGIRILPALYAMQMSLFTQNDASASLQNYMQLMHDTVFWRSMVNTFLYVVITVPCELAIGIGLALMIQRVHRLRWFYRMLYFLPYITSTVAVSWIWRLMYDPSSGLINELLGIIHVPPQQWLTSPAQALVSVSIVMIWQTAGFVMLIVMAGLEAIPRHFYDAAKVDGASSWQIFWRITWPLLNPTLVFLAVTGVIAALQAFTQIVNLTGSSGGFPGGPLNSTLSVVVNIYNNAFTEFNLQYASAMTVVLFVAILVVTLLQLRVLNRSFEY